jgi:GMP synthase-like glutamine amidotransferase
MKIGILQTGQAPEALRAEKGDYPDMFVRLLAGHGFDFAHWHVEAGALPASVHDADGWLITGSRHGVYEDHPWIPPLEEFIRRARSAGVPMAGICFGHQIMAQALGGRVGKFPGGWAVGPTTYDFDGQPVVMNAWHQDQVLSPPPGAETIAHNEFCTHAALSYAGTNGRWGYSVQAHPEFHNDFVAGLIEKRGRGLVPDPVLDAAAARLDTPIDSPRIADRIAHHFKTARARAA